jgi:sec-independent protein translocase protein TatC
VVYALYEISIQLVRMVENKREAELRAQGYYDDEDAEDDSAAADKTTDAAADETSDGDGTDDAPEKP